MEKTKMWIQTRSAKNTKSSFETPDFNDGIPYTLSPFHRCLWAYEKAPVKADLNLGQKLYQFYECYKQSVNNRNQNQAYLA
jgi:hypothetical protein